MKKQTPLERAASARPVCTGQVHGSWDTSNTEWEIWYKPVPLLWRWGFYRKKRRLKVVIKPDVPYVRTLEDDLLRGHK